MILPAWVKPTALGLVIAASFAGGWTAQGWRRDAMAKSALQKSAAALTKASADLFRAAGQFQKESTDEAIASQGRQAELRTIFREVQVPGACAAPAAAGGVLAEAVARANARAAGQPVGPVSAAPPAALAADRP